MKDFNEIIKDIQTLCGNKQLIMKHYYDRDCGHGDIVEVSFVMLTRDGENPYFIFNGELVEEEKGFECALLYYDTDLQSTLFDLYLYMKSKLKQ